MPTPLLRNLACRPEHTPDSVFRLSPSCPGVSGRAWGPSPGHRAFHEVRWAVENPILPFLRDAQGSPPRTLLL